MAEFRIDQATPGSGIDGRSRHDLVPGEVITLAVVSPIGVGVTYTWEILDQVGSAASLSSTSGSSVTIGPALGVVSPCAFLVRLTANASGVVTETTRIASVRTLSTNLRVPLFPETAPTSNKISSNNPDTSTDNAAYANRAGLGVSGQNWRGWAEWAWELTNAVESLSGGGSPSTGTKWWLESTDDIIVPSRYQYLVQGTILIDGGGAITADVGGQIVII
jgi:hypothetical protein